MYLIKKSVQFFDEKKLITKLQEKTLNITII